MSGSTIGGVIGGVVGFVVTGFNPAGAYWGYTLGSLAGGIIDPDKIRAPDASDAQAQTTTDGIPIPVVWGAPPPFFGTVLDGEQKSRRIKGKFQDGKGGPKVQDPDTFLWSGAILICRGPIAGIRRIRRNGVIVADWSDEPQIPAAETAAFASKIRIYLGTEDQLPDPLLETIHGVGNTPYYRGSAYMSITDDDTTDQNGTIARWSFEVVKSGEIETIVESEYAEPPLSRFQNGGWPLVDPDTDYDLVGTIYHANSVGAGGGLSSFAGNSIAEIMAHFQDHLGGNRTFNRFLGYSASTSSIGSYGNGDSQFGSFGFSEVEDQPDITDNTRAWLVFNDYPITETLPSVSGALCPVLPDGIVPGVFDLSGNMIAKIPNTTPGWFSVAGYCTPPGAPTVIAALPALYIQAARKRRAPSHGFGDPCDLQTNVLLPDAPAYLINCDGVLSPAPGVESVSSGVFRRLSEASTSTIDGRTQYTSYPVGPVLRSDDPNYNIQLFWENAYAAALLAGEPIAPGLTYGVDYPVSANATSVPVYQYTFSQTIVQSDEVFLSEVQQDLATLCDVPSSRIDVTALGAKVIPGYMVATEATGANCSRQLQAMFFYDMPEVDGAIRCKARGGPVVGTLTDENMVDVESDDDDIRSQQVEFPKAIHLAYPEPALNYAITKQTFERESFNVISIDEEIIQTTIPFDKDEAARIVEIVGKVRWAIAEGRMERTLAGECILWTPGDCYTYAGKRWLLQEGTYADWTLAAKAVYDRASAYLSNATGKGGRAPTPQGPNLRGPTRLETINVSPLLDAQDRLGLYFGVCGILPSWLGGILNASVDGGATYQQLGVFRNAAVMGHTTTELPLGSPWVFDPDAEVTVMVHGGEPEGATFLQLLNEANGCMIGNEAFQFSDAIEVDERTYRLVGLTRARHGTTMGDHPVHTRFVLLDDALNFVELPAAWIGQTITLHIQSIGTPAGTGYTEAFVWQPANAQTEWAPFHFEAEETDSSTLVSWIGRARLGTTAAPFHSSFFDGYRVTFTDGAVTRSFTTTDQHFDYSDAQRTTDFGSLEPLDVEIVALNRITGASPVLTGSI